MWNVPTSEVRDAAPAVVAPVATPTKTADDASATPDRAAIHRCSFDLFIWRISLLVVVVVGLAVIGPADRREPMSRLRLCGLSICCLSLPVLLVGCLWG
jgi:hypothetical protein